MDGICREEQQMNFASIKECDIANGTGVRVSLFVSGCRNNCPGCFNQGPQSFQYGEPYTTETEARILELCRPDYIEGLSLLGGEPMEPENQEGLLPLLRQFRAQYPGKTVWCYTGYLYDTDLQPGGRKYTPFTEEILSYINVLVDGRFVMAQKDITLRFRGSSNQRIINVPESRRQGCVVLFMD